MQSRKKIPLNFATKRTKDNTKGTVHLCSESRGTKYITNKISFYLFWARYVVKI